MHGISAATTVLEFIIKYFSLKVFDRKGHNWARPAILQYYKVSTVQNVTSAFYSS